MPKQILEAMQGEEALGYYGTVATPVVVVQVMATSIFNPMITELSEFYRDGKIRDFVKRTVKNLAELLVIAAAVYIGVALLGALQEKKKARTGYVVDTYKVYLRNGAEYKREKLCTSTYKMIQQVIEYN